MKHNGRFNDIGPHLTCSRFTLANSFLTLGV